MTELIWYASYGSNLSEDRFRCYIEGGTPEGSRQRESGARDHSPPCDERAIFLPHALYFAGHSKRWNGGIAWIDSDRDSAAQTLGRMYLIKPEQFIDVVRQENNNADLAVPFEQALEHGFVDIRDKGYGRLLHIDDRDGFPILTFTHPNPRSERPSKRPSDAYLQMIINGLVETYNLNPQGVRKYFLHCPGIDGQLSHGQAKKMVEKARLALGKIEPGQN